MMSGWLLLSRCSFYCFRGVRGLVQGHLRFYFARQTLCCHVTPCRKHKLHKGIHIDRSEGRIELASEIAAAAPELAAETRGHARRGARRSLVPPAIPPGIGSPLAAVRTATAQAAQAIASLAIDPEQKLVEKAGGSRAGSPSKNVRFAGGEGGNTRANDKLSKRERDAKLQTIVYAVDATEVAYQPPDQNVFTVKDGFGYGEEQPAPLPGSDDLRPMTRQTGSRAGTALASAGGFSLVPAGKEEGDSGSDGDDVPRDRYCE